MSLITECVFCLSDDSIDEEDSESAPLMATWHPDRKKFFVQGDGSNKSFYVHLADILSLKLDGGTSLFIKMTAYPLMNNKREKKIFEVHSRQSHHLYEELVKQGKELNIRKYFDTFKNCTFILYCNSTFIFSTLSIQVCPLRTSLSRPSESLQWSETVSEVVGI